METKTMIILKLKQKTKTKRTEKDVYDISTNMMILTQSNHCTVRVGNSVKKQRAYIKQFNITAPGHHMYGIHGVTGHPAAVTFLPLPQPKLVLNLAAPEGCQAELTWVSSPRTPKNSQLS